MFNCGIHTPIVAFGVVDRLTAPLVIEGVEAYDILCPVSSVTGLRENPLSLLKSLANDPVKSRAIDSIIMELPVLASEGKLDNDSLFDQLQSVFSSGSFYDDDKFAERLMQISSDLLKMQGVDQPITKVEQPITKVDKSSVESSDLSSVEPLG